MFFKQLDLTSGSRPILQQDESLLFVQDGVGLYEGNYKIAGCQTGHAYLTSHRACYIDDTEPRTNSVAIDLKDVERHEYQARFLRSSPKITLHPKPLKRGIGSLRHPTPSSSSSSRLSGSFSLPVTRTGSPFTAPSTPATAPPVYSGNWTCPICTYSNPVPSNFDPANQNFPLPPCLSCGIKPEFPVVLKAAIAANSNRTSVSNIAEQPSTNVPDTHVSVTVGTKSDKRVACPTCTFLNDRYLRFCELCNSPLPHSAAHGKPSELRYTDSSTRIRAESPGPEIPTSALEDKDEIPFVKFSFRSGGEKIFYERLKSAMVQRKWLVTNAPPIPRSLDKNTLSDGHAGSGLSTPDRGSTPRPTGVGIAGLEARGLQTRKNNEAVLGNAFEDLEALMASAREVVALAEKFALETQNSADAADPLLSQSAEAVGMIATKDMFFGASGSGGTSAASKVYITELARNLAEYVTDAQRGILRKQGGIMSLIDLWATFNRSRNGVELVSPSDFHKAAEMWSALNLPVRLRQFKSGLLVVQQRDRSDEKTIQQLKNWLHKLRQNPPEFNNAMISDAGGGEGSLAVTEVPWNWQLFGYGVTAQDAAREFGWSLGVATEELEMAEEKGVLCREESIQGLKFWLNWFVEIDP